MSADIKQVFLGSTYEDLVGYRKVAIETIRRFGWFGVAMEDFLSSDERPKELCLELVKKCDLYVGIFAHRYGYIPKGDNQSITEQEYRYARDSGIECLIFIVKADYPWRKDWIDRGKNEKLLLNLKKELRSNHTNSFFTNEDNLSTLLSASLANYTRKKLTKQLLKLSQKIPAPSGQEIPTIRLNIFRHAVIPIDVRCHIINESPFPTSVRTLLNATVDGKEYKLPVPSHYAGAKTWGMPAREGYEGHFNMEEYILKKGGFSYSKLRSSPKSVEIRIDYSALTHSGKWHFLGHKTYKYDFGKEYWQALV
ncbi:MAG: DUF4062 domain-containing protein [Candidatus Methanofastidiosia archaeon]